MIQSPTGPPGDPADEAQWLTGQQGRAALQELAARDLDWQRLSPAQVGQIRADHGDRTPGLVTQLALRDRARTKFGEEAGQMWFTRDGLEQATRPEVAAHRARRMARAGVQRVLDLGCGIGADARALAAAGIAVVAVESDPVTARFAAANADRAQVICADATDVVEQLWQPGDAIFLDPARRTATGRTWRVEDFTPPWDWVLAQLHRAGEAGGVGCVKLGPGLPHRLIPEGVEAQWVSHRGDLVEVALWTGLSGQGRRSATLIDPSGAVVHLGAEAGARFPASHMPEPGMTVWEPDPAIIRAGAVGAFAASHGLVGLSDGIAYLLAAQGRGRAADLGRFAAGFTITEVLPTKDKALRGWVREHRIGRLDIKKRGVDVDPALLRKKLKPAGPGRATLILTPTLQGARALVVEPVARPQ